MQIKIFGIPVFERTSQAAIPREEDLLPTKEQEVAVLNDTPAPKAYWDGSYSMGASVWAFSFDGEKNLGELGPIRNYIIDHEALRLRSNQLFLESEICQIVFQRFTRWVIGAGLKLQAQPQKEVLESEKIDIGTVEDFNKIVESRFGVYAEDSMSDYSDVQSLHEIAGEAFIHSRIGGDVLVVLRFMDNDVKVQLIDGCHVGTPLNIRFQGQDFITDGGNRVRHGVELDDRNQPVAYWVRQNNTTLKFERIPARGAKSGALMAFMVYGLKYRLDNVRGIPLITAVMETAKKMERYKEATLGSAEERQKIPYFIEHGVTSTGENPLMKQLAKANGFGNPGNDIPVDINGQQLADRVAATTNKQVYNMPQDSKIVALESKNELHFKDFYTVNIDIVCATVGIPPDVAMSAYDSNYSASRAAIKDWEHTLSVERKRFAKQFYQKIYQLWLDVQVLSNKIFAPGYLTALAQNNRMAISAYRTARWVGANVPHIDPVKEVQAERLKLGALGANLPLTTQEAATEALNGGDSSSNTEQYARELEEADELGIPVAVPQSAPVDTGEDEEKDEPPAPVKKKKGSGS